MAKRAEKAKNPAKSPASQSTAREGMIVPSHGVGRIAPWKPGVSGNPGGRPVGMKEVRDLCRTKSVDAANSLIRIIDDIVVDEDGRTHNREDGRIVVVAAQTILTWAWGKPPEYDPREDRPAVSLDTSVLSRDERALLLAMLRKGLVKDGTEVAPEPVKPVDDVPFES